jgi:hypothetical protein
VSWHLSTALHVISRDRTPAVRWERPHISRTGLGAWSIGGQGLGHTGISERDDKLIASMLRAFGSASCGPPPRSHRMNFETHGVIPGLYQPETSPTDMRDAAIDIKPSEAVSVTIPPRFRGP